MKATRDMEDNKHEANKNDICNEFAKEEEKPAIQTRTPKPSVLLEFPYAAIPVDISKPPYDYWNSDEEDIPFKVREFPCDFNPSDDSDSDSGNEFAKGKKQEPKIPKPKPSVLLEFPYAAIPVDISKPPYDYWNSDEEDIPFKVREFPCDFNPSDDSDSDSGNEFAKGKKQEPKIPKPKPSVLLEFPYAAIPVDISKPPYDYWNSDEEDIPFKVREFPCDFNPSDDSDSDSSNESGEETPIEPIEERLQLAKSSTKELVSGPTVPTSSILDKHGTKRAAGPRWMMRILNKQRKCLRQSPPMTRTNNTELDVQVNKKIS